MDKASNTFGVENNKMASLNKSKDRHGVLAKLVDELSPFCFAGANDVLQPAARVQTVGGLKPRVQVGRAQIIVDLLTFRCLRVGQSDFFPEA